MRRYSPNRRGNIETGGCKCGWDRKRQQYVPNGCKLHPGASRKNKRAHNVELSGRDLLKRIVGRKWRHR